jgi:hypothetical protein
MFFHKPLEGQKTGENQPFVTNYTYKLYFMRRV